MIYRGSLAGKALIADGNHQKCFDYDRTSKVKSLVDLMLKEGPP